ncbi:hypothetical protein MPER_11229 [Moniliophthora perniciosa FA553]|nr:hypothetical protein MPER_11229 [Moniliophthora perniciosa FA553]
MATGASTPLRDFGSSPPRKRLRDSTEPMGERIPKRECAKKSMNWLDKYVAHLTFTARDKMDETDERDWYIKNWQKGGPITYDARYMLRPETVESLFLAWRLTGNIRYRDYAWGIFTSIEKHCRLSEGGYATVLDVDTLPVKREDKQETFFLSETLKYLYLIFSDSSVLPFKDVVFTPR